MIKILYIVSPGHSGSTILDISLGQVDKFFSTGELVHLPWQLFRTKETVSYTEDYCTCGKAFQQCDAWKAVCDEIKTVTNKDIISLPEKFKLGYLDNLNYFKKPILFRITRKLVAISNWNLFRKCIYGLIALFYKKVTNNNWVLYNAITKASGKKVVVDSSKDLLRLAMLLRSNRDAVQVVILVRDVLGVISSSYSNSKDLDKKADMWLSFYNKRLKNLLVDFNIDDYIVLSYERFIENPEKTLNIVTQRMNDESYDSDFRIDMYKYHLVAGNPSRYRKDNRLNKDMRWEGRLSKKEIEIYSSYNQRLLSLFQPHN